MFNSRNCFVFKSQADFMLESLTVNAAHLFPDAPLVNRFFLLSREKLYFFSALSLGLRPACISSPSRHLPSVFKVGLAPAFIHTMVQIQGPRQRSPHIWKSLWDTQGKPDREVKRNL